MEKELNVGITTTANTSGIKEAQDALEGLKEASAGHLEYLDTAIDSTEKLTAVEKTFGLEADEVAHKQVEKNESLTKQIAGESTLKKKKDDNNTSDNKSLDLKRQILAAEKAIKAESLKKAGASVEIDKTTQSVNSLTAGTGNLATQSVRTTGSVKNMGAGALQAAYFFDDLQYGMKGIMNNIPGLVMGLGGGMGLAGALSVALLAGVKLYEWAADTKAEEAKAKKIKEIAEAAKELDTSLGKTIDGLKTERIIGQSVKETEKLVSAYKEATGEIDKQIALLQKKLAIEKGIWDAEAERDLAILEAKLIKGEITQRDFDVQKNQIDHMSKERQLENEKTLALATDKSKEDKANGAESTRKKMDDQYNKDWGAIGDVKQKEYAEGLRALQQGRQTLKDLDEDQGAWLSEWEKQKEKLNVKLLQFGMTMEQAQEEVEAIKKNPYLRRDIKAGLYESYDGMMKAENVVARIEKDKQGVVDTKINPALNVVNPLNKELYSRGLLSTRATPEEAAAKAQAILAERDAAKARIEQAKKEEEEAKKASKASKDALDNELKIIEAKKAAASAVFDTSEVRSLEEARKKAIEEQNKAIEEQVKTESEKAKVKKEELDLAKEGLAVTKKDLKSNRDDAKSRFDSRVGKLESDPITGAVVKNKNSAAGKAITETEKAIADGKISDQEKSDLIEELDKVRRAYKGTSENGIYEAITASMKDVVGSMIASQKAEVAAEARVKALAAEIKAINKQMEQIRNKIKR